MNLFILFISCLMAMALIPIYFPSLHLFFFLPFLVVLLYRSSLVFCLAAAMGCGLIMDLLSSDIRLGIYCAAYAAAIAVFWWICRLFFFESLRTAPLLAIALSALTTLFLMGIGWAMGEMWFPERAWWFKDVLLFSVLDGIYTATWIALFNGRIGKRSEPLFA